MFSHEGYQALRRAAGVVRRGDRGLLAVTGPDRLTWLQGLLTNDVAALPIGGVCDAAYLTPQGRMITDARVINVADGTWLDVPASLASALQTKLDGLLFSEDAQVVDASSTHALVELHGPLASSVHAAATPAPDRAPVAAVIDDPLGLPSVALIVRVEDVTTSIDRLIAHGATEVFLETLDVVRVEAGRPAFLIDMDEHTIPLEAGLEQRAISFTKGCYVGQEVIVRVMHRGQGRVAKKLVGLRLAKGELPKSGDAIAAGDREVGRVTSVVWSPTAETGIALGYVHRDVVEPGTTLQVRAAQGALAATVSAFPFVGEV
jgi:folate-binding protein YgfZ